MGFATCPRDYGEIGDPLTIPPLNWLATPTPVAEAAMTPDWNTVRLDLIDIDQSMRATLRTMRPFFAKCLPVILAKFYDKVRRYDPDSGLFKNNLMQEAIRLQLQHWELIAASDVGPAYARSLAEF